MTWYSPSVILTADIVAEDVAKAGGDGWQTVTITLNDHSITPAAGESSAFELSKGSNLVYVVDDETEFANAAADPQSTQIRLAADVTLNSGLVLKNGQVIDENGYTLTLGRRVSLTAETSNFTCLKASLADDRITSVKLTADISATESLAIEDLSKLDLNGYTITPDPSVWGVQISVDNVNTQEELVAALSLGATTINVTGNIQLHEELVIDYSVLSGLEMNGYTINAGPRGGLIVEVDQSSEIADSLSRSYVNGVKLIADVELTEQVNVDSLDQIDENGYTLSYGENGKVALNVGNEEELRQALANDEVDYINLTGNINLRRDITITADSFPLPQIISNGYSITGRGSITCYADSWELLKAACDLGLPGMKIYLAGDITQGEGTATITADTTVEMYFNTITTSENTLFDVQGGKLTIMASQPWGHNYVNRNPVEDTSEDFCKPAYVYGDYFHYYITKSDVVASGGYANAGTKETRWHYSVKLDEVGFVDATSAKSCVFNVGSNGQLDIQGGIFYGGYSTRAIYALGNVTMDNDVVFANFGDWNGGAVYMGGGELTIKEHTQGLEWHGVVFTGNQAWPGSSGGAIYIDANASMTMEDGYITNNWIATPEEDDGGWSGGGGVGVLGQFVMNGGYVTANQAQGGGGIKTIINGNWDEGGDFLMTGGHVSGNLANKYEGGGIVINHSGYGKITGGYITNNETKTVQHWGGGGIFISDYGYMDMEAVFVINNEAGGYGGGVAGCSTGRIDTHDTSDNMAHSTAIFDNTAAGEHMSGTESTKDVDRVYAYNDPVFNRDGGAHYQDYFCALSSYICGGMLGDGTSDWSGTIDGEAIHQGTVDKDDVLVGVSITGLTNHSTQADRNDALRAAKVFISGNESYTHGGGILCNGYLVIGHEHHATIGDRLSVSGTKATSGFSLKAGAFGFYLVQDLNGNREPDELYFTDIDAERYGVPFVTTATNDANGLVDFAHRIPFSEDGKFYYMIFEATGSEPGVVYDQTSYLLTVTVGRDVLTVVETPDGNKHDIIAEPKTVTFYRIEKVELAKKEAGASSYGDSTVVFEGTSGANSSVDLNDLFTFTNTKTQVETTEIKVTKKWVDSDNQDGVRPEEITVQLYADGVAVTDQVATLTGTGNEWTYTFTDLPKHVTGTETEITYTVKEVGEVTGYTTAYSDDFLTITNTHETEETEISVTKKWVDSDNQDGIRPEEITVQLLADGVVVEGKTATLTGEGNEWTYTFSNLPKYADGEEIVYAVQEIGTVTGYITGYSADGLTITNTHETDTTEIEVTKKWVDSDNQDGIRPEEITVQLYADGVAVTDKVATLTGEGNEWTYTFSNLPKYADGVEIVYTVQEVGEIVGYTTAYSDDTLTITNTHETGTTEIEVTKKWVDSDNQDGIRPEEITVQLYADGVAVTDKVATLTGTGNEWTYTFSNLPKMADGKEIVYTVQEVGEIVGYTTAYSADTLTITNTHETGTTEISVTKKWVDSDNQDGLRPESITVQLLADGEVVEGKTATLTGTGNEWRYTFSNLPKYADGKEIVYTVQEVGEIVGYTTAYSDDTLTITNTHETGTTEVEVTKKWVDSDNQDGIRPEEITVQLYADGVAVTDKVATLTGTGNEWTYTFSNLPKYADGEEIVYTVQEVGEIVGYTTAYSADTLTITNTHETGTTEIEVTKKWVDSDNQDGLRPESITVQLLADGVVVEGKTATLTGTGNEWTYTFSNLPKMADGKEIVYTVQEVGEIVGYTTAYSADTLTITNTHETGTTEIEVTKKWVDSDNQDGLRPESITVQLLADGEVVEGKTATLTGNGNEWTYTFSNLPKYADGVEIVYTVQEVGEIVGYTTAYSDDALTITNTHETGTTEVEVTKKWVDSDNQDGLRPEEITVQLLADGEVVEGKTATLTGTGNEWTYTFSNLPKMADGKEIVYTVQEVGEIVGYTTAYSDDTLTITNAHETGTTEITVTKKWVDSDNQDGIRPESITVQLYADGVAVTDKDATLTGEGNEWTYTFSNLPKYADGVEIVYTVQEVGEIVGYTTAYSDDTLTITNTHETGTTEVEVTKKWVDSDNQDGLRPESITVQLLADGEVVTDKVATLTGTGNEWTYTFSNLPKMADGKEIVYTVQEVGEIVGYTTAYSDDTLTITNTHETGTTEIEVTKKWVDSDNQDGLRPEEITVQLLADGVAVEGKTAVLTGTGNEWTYTFSNLPKMADGKEIVYTVQEVGEIVGYTTAYSEDTLTITNTHETGTTEIEVTKKWVDSDNQDGLRPESITVQLLADGEVVADKVATLTGEGNEWTYTFSNLPKYADGVEIVYTVQEVGEIVGYTTAYSEDTLTITNTHETGTTEIEVTKKWVDSDNQDGLRPESITVQLYADGEVVADKVATLTGEGNEWTYTFSNLPKYADGEEIVYTVEEVGEIVGYTTAYSADTLTITNTHETGTTEISVTKKWVDSDNQDGLRPESITVQLLADGEVVEGKTATLTGTGNEWTYTFSNLPKMADGKEIVYTVQEVGEIVGYTTAYSDDTLTITNTHETGTTEIEVTKKWVDSDNQDGLRPESITVQLLADGEVVADKVATLNGEGNEWTYTFSNLPKMADGKEIVYTVQEVGEIVGYTTAYSADTLTITNTHETGTTEISVTKKWVDGNNHDGLRPTSVTVRLLADGVAVEGKTAVITGVGNEWTYTFSNLPKMADGKEIVYTVEEVGEIVGYTTAYSDDTLTITNTHEVYKRYVIAVVKTDAVNEDKVIAGAKFAVYSDAACTQLVGTITTDAQGKGELGDLLAGTYYLVETAAPAGYQLDSTVHAVEAGETTGKTVTVALVNYPLIGSLTLEKTVVGDGAGLSFLFEVELANTTGDELSGAYSATLNGVATTVTFTATAEGAKASVTLKDGDTLTILGLRTGTNYTVTEQPGDFYTTTVNGAAGNAASGTITESGVSIAAFENKLLLTDFSVKKTWNGLEAGEDKPEISLVLYCNGKVYSTVTPAPTAGGWYIWEDLPSMVDGVKAVYTVVEKPVDGFTTTYVNTGDNAAEDGCAYDGGTIVNSKIPQTGDHTHVLLWLTTLMLAAFGLLGVKRLRRSGN